MHSEGTSGGNESILGLGRHEAKLSFVQIFGDEDGFVGFLQEGSFDDDGAYIVHCLHDIISHLYIPQALQTALILISRYKSS